MVVEREVLIVAVANIHHHRLANTIKNLKRIHLVKINQCRKQLRHHQTLSQSRDNADKQR